MALEGVRWLSGGKWVALNYAKLLAMLSKPVVGKRSSDTANETRDQNQAEQKIASQAVGYSALYSGGNKPHQRDDSCRSGHSANEEPQNCHHTGVDQGPR